MPGMMDTILNLGLNDTVVEGLAKKTENPRFAWDSYRRFVQMYGDVVLGMKPTNKDDIDPFEAIIEDVKKSKGVKLDNELDTDDLKTLVKRFKEAVKEQTHKDFPTDAYEQLWGAICAVFDSWMNERAILYRKMEGIPAEWEQPFPLWQWYSGTWEILQPQVYAFHAMQQQVKTSSTVNT